MKPSKSTLALSLVVALGLSACSAGQSGGSSDPSGKSASQIKEEKEAAEDAAEKKADEEAVAKKYPPAPAGSKLAKVTPGMTEAEVREILGPPTSQNNYETGKKWIPGYGAFAKDAYRTEFVYKGVGLVTFNKDQWTGKLTVYRTAYDPSR